MSDKNIQVVILIILVVSSVGTRYGEIYTIPRSVIFPIFTLSLHLFFGVLLCSLHKQSDKILNI